MPRRVQDIIPGNRRSIRDIPVDRREVLDESPRMKEAREKRAEKAEKKDEEEIEIHREHIPDQKSALKMTGSKAAESKESNKKSVSKKKRSRFPWVLSTLGLVVILAGIAFGIAGHFASAVFTLTPRSLPVAVNSTYIIPSAFPGSFGYDLVALSGQASTTIPATQGSYTESKAQGSVTVYNAYSATSQRLVAGSRLSNNSGLVYRLTSSIIVPGYRSTGSTVIPGSIIATIVADKAGSEYNISQADTISDFKFTAYTGTPKYNNFYARLNTDVSGGFTGTKIVVSPSLLASTSAMISASLSKNLQQTLMSTVPIGYVMYPNLYVSASGAPTVTSIDVKTAKVNVPVTLYGIMFNKIDFAKYLAGATSTLSFGAFGYNTPAIEDLSVSMINPKAFSPSTKGNLVIRASGSFNLVGSVPVDILKKALAGISLSQTADVLKKYTSVIDIAHSSAEISPPWVGKVPSDPSRINVVVKGM